LSTAVAYPARVPARPAHLIVRSRLLAWLERHASTRLRALVAPPGFGKSVLLAQYAGSHPSCRLVAIGRLQRVTDRLPMILCERLGLPPEAGLCVDSALEAINTLAPCEIALDEIDALRPEDAQALAQIVAGISEHVRLIVASRSRERVADPRRLLDGTTATLGAAQLAFRSEEVAQLCALLDLEPSAQHAGALLRESDGWPLVVSGALTAAADAGASLADALSLWKSERGVTLREMVLDDAASSDLGPVLARLCTGETLATAEDLQALERAGLYVCATPRGLALLHPVGAVFDPHDAAVDVATLPDVAPMFVQMLGEFDVRIAGKRVEWVRRKDALLFKYLLLEPLGRASRADLCEAFWPTHDRDQARQNLRTTCSNIRAALRRCLPESRVDLYFRTEGRDVVLRSDLAITDLARFSAHVAAARDAMAAQRLDRAAEAYESARALYRGPLIADPSTDAHAAVAREVDESFNEIQRHLTALRRLHASVVPLHAVVA
jgi:hypothetical protein